MKFEDALTKLSAIVDELFLASLAEGKEVRLRVDGTSMLPSLKPGDVVVLKLVEPEQLQKGDLVVVRREGAYGCRGQAERHRSHDVGAAQ